MEIEKSYESISLAVSPSLFFEIKTPITSIMNVSFWEGRSRRMASAFFLLALSSLGNHHFSPSYDNTSTKLSLKLGLPARGCYSSVKAMGFVRNEKQWGAF